MKAIKVALLGLLIAANASFSYGASKHETKDNLVKVVSGIVARECNEAEKSLDLKRYSIDKDIKDMDKFVRLSYQKCSPLEDFIRIVTLGGLLAPKSFNEFSSLRSEISSAQNSILDSVYADGVGSINEDIFKSYMAKNIPHDDLVRMYRKAFDLGGEFVRNEMNKDKTKAETARLDEKRRFLLVVYSKGCSYIDSAYKGAKEKAKNDAKEIHLASENSQ
ncbi:hypothetical protein HYT26_04235 [Candidatus Pacearchaeota archaeon]|nr:hypothetical protein [Candidatus Pacearchaeota archaeon]